MSEQATRTPDRTIGEKPLSYFKAVDALEATWRERADRMADLLDTPNSQGDPR